MRVLAPAKLNLYLRVGAADQSGFHPLMSWICTVGLFDTLTIEPADKPGISLTCDRADLPCDHRNLIVRAAGALREELSRSRDPADRGPKAAPGVKVHLEKRIPMGGGLGGGSSNAAHVLLALNRLWNLNWPVARLARVAASLGSDVPFFLYGPSSICTGRGERVQPTNAPRSRWAVLILPALVLPTPDVYRKFDELGLADVGALDAQPPFRQWAELGTTELLGQLVNDLEPASFALSPELSSLQQSAEKTIGRAVRMSGSGSSLFTLFDESGEAKSAAAHIHDRLGISAAAVDVAPPLADAVLAG
jgi:4-diphosphocytidyl-2-C-methyl-D-erythritol kinase